MAKIIVHVKLNSGDKFFEIQNLSRIWINDFNVYGRWALMYSDDRYKYNTLFYSSDYEIADYCRKKLIEAYKNGERIITL